MSRFHVINPALLVEGEWASLAGLSDAAAVRGTLPADGLKEGRDYMEVGPDQYRNRFLCWTGSGDEVECDSLADAHLYMEAEGFVATGEWASDAITEDGGRVLWDGRCDFYAAKIEDEDGFWDGELETYSEGYEPRIRILHRVREIGDDED